MNPDTSTSLASLIERLSAPIEDPTVGVARMIVVTDWSKGAAPLTALRAFRTLVPSSAPVQLVFAVPHEPTEVDAACINVLTEELGMPGRLEGLEVESFDEVLEQPYDSALVPTADPEDNFVQLGGFILRMRDLMRIQESARGGAGRGGVTTNPGSLDALRERLAAFAA